MRTDTKQPRPLWDSREVGEHLGGIPIGTLDQWAYKGVGPAYIKVGRHRRYRPEDVEAWLDAQTRGGAA
jgi:DNA-binding transcriptional MerR regulator